jgi:hypothetical protein
MPFRRPFRASLSHFKTGEESVEVTFLVIRVMVASPVPIQNLGFEVFWDEKGDGGSDLPPTDRLCAQPSG